MGSLFSWKSSLTNLRTSEDYFQVRKMKSIQVYGLSETGEVEARSYRSRLTLPTAASPRSTSFTLLLGFGAFESAIVCDDMFLEGIMSEGS